MVQRRLGGQRLDRALLPLPIDGLAGHTPLQHHAVRLHIRFADVQAGVRQQRFDGIPARARHQRLRPHQHLGTAGPDQLFGFKGSPFQIQRHRKTLPSHSIMA